MHEVPGTVKCDYAQPDKVTAETNNQERPIWAPEPGCHEGPDFGLAPGDSTVRIIQHPTSEDKGNGTKTNKKLKSTVAPQARASKGQGHPHARSRRVYHKGFSRLPFVQNGNENLDDQIRFFKEREDLRECLIPGMVDGISQKACEGWRRQATARYARYLAKVKLDLCKDCKYVSEPVVLD
jgi:hypothetical protein